MRRQGSWSLSGTERERERERERGVTGMWNKKLGLRVEHLSVYFFFLNF